MSELVGQNPNGEKNTPQRRAAARQLRAIRQVERAGLYIKNRTSDDYQDVLDGLKYYFDYVRKLGTSDVVLDVGSGTTQGIWELSHSNLGRGLKFMATGLDRDPVVEAYIGTENFRITSGEVLRGIPDNSVAAILALNSVAYSAAPEMVVRRFDQVLVPGGVIKGTFRSQNLVIAADFYERTQFKTPNPFIEVLKQLGYDIAVFDHGTGSNMLAIKPGGFHEVTAQQLLDSDRVVHEQQKATDTEALLNRATSQIPSYLTQDLENRVTSQSLLAKSGNNYPIQHSLADINSLILNLNFKQNNPLILNSGEKFSKNFFKQEPEEKRSLTYKYLWEQKPREPETWSTIAALAAEQADKFPSPFSNTYPETNAPSTSEAEMLGLVAQYLARKKARPGILGNSLSGQSEEPSAPFALNAALRGKSLPTRPFTNSLAECPFLSL